MTPSDISTMRPQYNSLSARQKNRRFYLFQSSTYPGSAVAQEWLEFEIDQGRPQLCRDPMSMRHGDLMPCENRISNQLCAWTAYVRGSLF